MALLDFQTALGCLVRAPGAMPLRPLHLDAGEISCLDTLKASAGFRFTVEVQRSWCVGRATRAGSLTLSVLTEDLRRQLLDQWIETGGGTSSFFAAESEALLEFIGNRLRDPSHELTVCRFEQATLRANQHAMDFPLPMPDLLPAMGCALRRGRYAGMATFYGEPYAIIEALVTHQELPPVTIDVTTMLFAPGLDGLCRVATSREVALWQKLTEPIPLSSLLAEGYNCDDLIPMLQTGIAEFAVSKSEHR